MSEISLEALANAAVLDSIDFVSLSAERHREPAEAADGAEGRMSIEFEARPCDDDARFFRYILDVQFANAEGTVRVQPCATYHVDQEYEALLDNTEVTAEFGGKVAVMTLLPYAREAVASLSTRVFSGQVLMPVFTASQLRFAVQSPAVHLEPDDADPDPGIAPSLG